MSLLNVNKIDPATGTALEIGSSGDTITIPSGATLNVSGSTSGITAAAANLAASGDGGVTGILPVANGGTAFTTVPYFQVSKGSDQAISSDTFTTVTFDQEIYDNGGNFASNTFTAPATGFYYIYSQLVWSGTTNSDYSLNRLMKNGSPINWNAFFQTNSSGGYGGRLVSLSASDTVTVQCYQDSGGSLSLRGSSEDECQFGGFRVVA
jgi:hypothetical protein